MTCNCMGCPHPTNCRCRCTICAETPLTPEALELGALGRSIQNYTAVRCVRCNKEMKRITEGMIVHRGNPKYCGECNETIQDLPC